MARTMGMGVTAMFSMTANRQKIVLLTALVFAALC